MNEKEIYFKIQEWLSNKHEVAIATVIETWGSSPRPVGSIMAINDKNEIIGSVSGGCVESFVFGKAIEVIKSNNVETLDFGVSNSKAWEVGLTCGGKIKVFLEKISIADISYINKIIKTFSTEKKLIIATRLKDGKKEFFDGDSEFNNSLLKNNLESFHKIEKSTLKGLSDDMWFLKVYKTNIKVIIVGAVHIAEPLIKFSTLLGYKVFLIDPRDNFADKIFNKVTIYKEWPDEALKRINIDESTSIVTLTHDPKLDDPALEYSLESNAFYIGCLGSKKTHLSRQERLKRKGLSDKKIKKLHGPVGLNIGAKTPTEIALSIISQIIEIKNKSHA